MSNNILSPMYLDALSKNTNIKSIEDWVEAAVDILRDNNLYWFLVGKEDEYNGKVIVKLSLPKFKFAAIDESKLNKFDKNFSFVQVLRLKTTMFFLCLQHPVW